MPRLGDSYVLVTDGGPAYIAGSLYQKGAKGKFQPIAHFFQKGGECEFIPTGEKKGISFNEQWEYL